MAAASDSVPDPIGPTTATGTELGPTPAALFPSWPSLLSPQHSTPLEESTAQVWAPPAAIATTPESIPVPVDATTATGTGLPVKELFPSSPEPFAPQQATPPDEGRAQVCA